MSSGESTVPGARDGRLLSESQEAELRAAMQPFMEQVQRRAIELLAEQAKETSAALERKLAQARPDSVRAVLGAWAGRLVRLLRLGEATQRARQFFPFAAGPARPGPRPTAGAPRQQTQEEPTRQAPKER